MRLIITKHIKNNSKYSELGLGTFATTIVLLIVATLSVALINWSKPELRLVNQKASKIERPPLYLPSAKYIKFVTLGFDNFFSDVLWFNTINYFGKQLKGSRDYRWLNHMCDLVTELDHKKKYAYEFCSTMLAWESKEFEASNKILNRGIENNPDYWRLWYLRAFNNWYFLDDRKKAAKDMSHASRLPEAPPFVSSLAASLIADTEDIKNSIRFLEDMIRNSSDENSKKALTERLNMAYISRDVEYIKKTIGDYEKSHNKKVTDLNELVAQGYKIPLDPYRGKYYIDKKTGEILNTSKKQGLEFKGKNKDTGIFAQENQKIETIKKPEKSKNSEQKNIESQGEVP